MDFLKLWFGSIFLAAIFFEVPKLMCALGENEYHLMCFIPGMPGVFSSKTWIFVHTVQSLLHLSFTYYRFLMMRNTARLSPTFEMVSNFVFLLWVGTVLWNYEIFMVNAPLFIGWLALLMWTWRLRRDLCVFAIHYLGFTLPVIMTLVAIVKFLGGFWLYE